MSGLTVFTGGETPGVTVHLDGEQVLRVCRGDDVSFDAGGAMAVTVRTTNDTTPTADLPDTLFDDPDQTTLSDDEVVVTLGRFETRVLCATGETSFVHDGVEVAVERSGDAAAGGLRRSGRSDDAGEADDEDEDDEAPGEGLDDLFNSNSSVRLVTTNGTAVASAPIEHVSFTAEPGEPLTITVTPAPFQTASLMGPTVDQWSVSSDAGSLFYGPLVNPVNLGNVDEVDLGELVITVE